MKNHVLGFFICFTIIFVMSGIAVSEEAKESDIRILPYGMADYMDIISGDPAKQSSVIKTNAFKPQIISTSANNDLQVLGLWFINSGRSTDQDILVFRLLFNVRPATHRRPHLAGRRNALPRFSDWRHGRSYDAQR